MNIRSLAPLAMVGFSLVLASALNAAEPAMAFVSMERLFDEYYKTKAANIQLKARFESVDTTRRELLNQVKTIKAEIEKLGAEARDKSLSDAERDKKRTAAEDKIVFFRDAETKLAEFDNTYKKQFGDEMKQSQQKLVGEIRDVIAAYTKERGIKIVFDSSGKTLNNIESVVCYDPSMDITDPIMAILNKNATEPGVKSVTEPETKKSTEPETKKKTP